MLQYVSKCGSTKIFLQIIFEEWIFVAYNKPQNQTDLNLLHVADNKIHRRICG